MRVTKLLWVGQMIWLGLTLVFLVGLLSFTHPGYGLTLLVGSSVIVGKPLYRALVQAQPSPRRQLGLWAFWLGVMSIGLGLPMYWFLGLGQTWHSRWVWPTTEGSAWQCAFQNKPSLGEGDFRYIVGLPIGPVATVVLEVYDLNFAWVTEAQTTPQRIAHNVAMDQQQLGPYFNQAPWYRLGQKLGWVADTMPTQCDFKHVIRVDRPE